MSGGSHGHAKPWPEHTRLSGVGNGTGTEDRAANSDTEGRICQAQFSCYRYIIPILPVSIIPATAEAIASGSVDYEGGIA